MLYSARIKITKWSESLARIEDTLSVLSAVAVLIMMFGVLEEVTSRMLGIVVPGVYELIELLMVAVAFWGVAAAQRKKIHVRLDAVERLSPTRVKTVLKFFQALLELAVFSLITYYSAKYAYHLWSVGEYKGWLLHFPLWPSAFAVVIGTGFLCLRLFMDLLVIRTPSPKQVTEQDMLEVAGGV